MSHILPLIPRHLMVVAAAKTKENKDRVGREFSSMLNVTERDEKK